MNNVYFGLGVSSSIVALGIFIYLIIKPSGVSAISDQNDDIYYDEVDGDTWYNNMY